MLKVFVIAKPCKRLRQSVFLFKGITDSFVLRTQNDRPFSHCGAGVRWTPLRSRSTDRAGRQDRRKVRGNPSFRSTSLRSRANGCGNPFFYLRVFTDSFVLTTLAVPKSCYSLGARTTFDRGASFCSLFPAPQALATSLRMTDHLVFAVRVSGGHLCEAEAPIGPADETAVKRCFFIFYVV